MEVTPNSAVLENFLSGSRLGRQVYDAVAALIDDVGPATARVTKSQVAFRHRTGFCWVWLPGMYLTRPAAEVVLTVALARQDTSPRWKQTVAVSSRRWMHHLEVHDLRELDGEVAGWVVEAYEVAG